MAESSTQQNILALAALALGIAALILAGGVAIAVVTFAFAFAATVIVHGSLAGVAFAPEVTAIASSGVALTCIAGLGVVTYQALKRSEREPFNVAVPILAIANSMFMALAYELLPEGSAGLLGKVLVSGLSPAGLVVGALVFNQPGFLSKIVGAILHLVFQAATISWLVWTALKNAAFRKVTIESLCASPIAVGLILLATLTVLPALAFLTWNDCRKPSTTSR